MNAAERARTEQHAVGGRISKGVYVAESARLAAPVDIADDVTIYQHCEIGAYSYINVRSVVYAKTKVGRFCSIGRGVELGLAQHPAAALSTHPFVVSGTLYSRNSEYATLTRPKSDWAFHHPTEVGSDVWIGNGSMVTTGIKVGHGAIIAAGAVVTKDVEPYAIVGGVPARTIRARFDDSVVADLLSLAWWELPLAELDGLPLLDIRASIELLKERRHHTLPTTSLAA